MNNYKNEDYSHGLHKIEVTLQMGKYKGTFTTQMGGNCKGGSILQSFCDLEYFEECDILENNCELSFSEDDDGDYWFSCTLTDEDGNKCTDEEEIKYLNNLIVGVNIISFEEDNDEK